MSHLQKRLKILKNPSMLWHLGSCFTATLGGGVFYIVSTWVLLTIHNSVSAVAINMACFWLPGAVLTPFIGVIVDRVSRKQVVVFTNIGRVLLLVASYPVFTHHISSYGIYLISLVMGCLIQFYIPAVMTLVREIVPEEDLLYANSTIDIVYEVGNVLGIASAGILMTWCSPIEVISMIGVVFVISAICSAFIKSHAIPSEKERTLASFFNDMQDGWHYIRDVDGLFQIYSIQMLVFVVFMTSPILLAPFAKDILQVSTLQFGNIEACLSLGVVLGGFVAPILVDWFSLTRVLVVVLVGLGICFALFSQVTHLVSAEVIYFFLGLFLAAWPLIVTEAQSMTALEFQGRVQATFNAGSSVIILIVYALSSELSRIFSIRAMYRVEVGLCIIALVFMMMMFRKRVTD